MGVASPKVQNFLFRFERYGLIVVIALLYFRLLNPVIDFFREMILSVINLFLS